MSVTKDLGMVTAYAYAISEGYAGTEEQFAALMASYADVGQTAVDAAQTATTAAQTATTKAGEATTAATTATGMASQAAQSATQAAASATTAGTAATNAQTAQTAAEAAQTAAETAQGAAEDAAESVEGKTEQIDQNTEDISLLKSHLDAMSTASASDEGKALIAKTVTDGTVTEWEFGETGGGGAPEIVCNASGAVASFADGADNRAVKGLTVNIEPIQSGTGDPSPDNVRPISGRTSVGVARSGVNLFNGAALAEALPQYFTYSDDGTVKVKTSLYIGWAAQAITGYLEPGEYTFSASDPSSTTVTVEFRFGDEGASTGAVPLNNSNGYVRQKTITERTAYRVRITSNAVNDSAKIQIETGNKRNTFAPYTAQSIEVQLGQTVYGGTVDVVSGEMVVDRVYEDIKANVNSYTRANTDTSGQYYYRRFNSNTDSSNTYSGEVFTHGSIGNPYAYSSENRNDIATVLHSSLGADIRVGSFGYDTLADWVAYISSQDVCGIVYPIITPLTVQLVGQSLTTLKGTNNIWSDGGDVAVDYVADTKLFIEQLTEPDADMVADSNITSGKYFMVGNSLFLATANIASGAAITPGVNCTRTSLAAALNAINA